MESSESQRFEELSQTFFSQERQKNGIGTLSERTLHSFVKQWIEPNTNYHEQKLKSYIVDIFDGSSITEIQTKQFFKLIPKLDALLDDYPITIVYPITYTKYLSWINTDTQEHSKPRKSPKTGSVLDAVEELYALKTRLAHPNLSIQLLFFDVLETRLLNGWSEDKKKGSHRHDRTPYRYHETHTYQTPQDYLKLLPDDLPVSFTSQDLKRKGITLRKAQLLLNVLVSLNCIEPISKKGRFKEYKRTYD